MENMIQRCPKCGQWLRSTRSGVLSRAANGWTNAVESSANAGASFLGEKVGSILGGAVGGYLGLVNGYFEAIAGDKFQFECPECGYKWSTDDESDDESEEYNIWCEEEDRLDELNQKWLQADDMDDYEALSSEISDCVDEFSDDKAHVAKLIDLQALCQFYLGNYEACIDKLFSSMQLIPYSECLGMIGLAKSRIGHETAEEAYDIMTYLSLFITSGEEGIYFQNEIYENEFNKMLKIYLEKFDTIPIKKKKFITFVDYYSLCEDDILPLRLQDIPNSFIFPGGQPVTGVLYVANPVKPNIYYRAEDYELSTFRDQLDDFLIVLSSLGAKKLSFHDARTKEILSDSRNTCNVNGSITYDSSADVQFSSDRNKSAYYKLCNDYFREMEFAISNKTPTKPSTPWFKIMTDWQALAHQRIDLGTALKDHRRISLNETATLQNETKTSIATQFNSIIASFNANGIVESKNVFSENYDFCWEYDVEFYPLQQYNSAAQNRCYNQNSSLETPELQTHALTIEEQEYLEEVKSYLEDGEIGPRERKSLERHRDRLGISVERAKELESSLVTPSLSDDEIQYLEEVKFVLEDGEIGPRERKSLERHRVRLGIAEERAREIEILAER